VLSNSKQCGRDTERQTVNAGQFLDLVDVGLCIHRQISKLTTTFSAAEPARQTTVLHLYVSELFLTRYRHTDTWT